MAVGLVSCWCCRVLAVGAVAARTKNALGSCAVFACFYDSMSSPFDSTDPFSVPASIHPNTRSESLTHPYIPHPPVHTHIPFFLLQDLRDEARAAGLAVLRHEMDIPARQGLTWILQVSVEMNPGLIPVRCQVCAHGCYGGDIT